MLNYALATHPYRILFTAELSDPKIIEQLQFVHLIEMRFEGEVDPERIFRSDDEVQWVVRFRDDHIDLARDACAWCKQHLKAGQVASAYVGALSYADPNGTTAKQFLEKISALPL